MRDAFLHTSEGLQRRAWQIPERSERSAEFLGDAKRNLILTKAQMPRQQEQPFAVLDREAVDAFQKFWLGFKCWTQRSEQGAMDVAAPEVLRLGLRLRERRASFVDPHHPAIALATRRIEELSARAASISEAIAALRAKRPTGSSPDEIAAMLDAIPDMRDALATADETELAEIFEAFDVTATYDKANARLELSATVTPELVTDQEKATAPEGGRGIRP